MRVGRPSRFGVVALIVALALGISLNLYLINREPTPPPAGVGSSFGTAITDLSDPRVPKIPQEIIDEYGSPMFWNLRHGVLVRECSAVRIPMRNNTQFFLAVKRYGFPWTGRSTMIMRAADTRLRTVWPVQGGMQVPPAVTYHPLGLILNPIIYALPVWLVMMGVRWLLLARRARRRERLGLCARCAYDLGELAACPECGHPAANAHAAH